MKRKYDQHANRENKRIRANDISTLTDLPTDTLICIFQCFDYHFLVHLSLVCREFNRVICPHEREVNVEKCQVLWKHIAYQQEILLSNPNRASLVAKLMPILQLKKVTVTHAAYHEIVEPYVEHLIVRKIKLKGQELRFPHLKKMQYPFKLVGNETADNTRILWAATPLQTSLTFYNLRILAAHLDNLEALLQTIERSVPTLEKISMLLPSGKLPDAVFDLLYLCPKLRFMMIQTPHPLPPFNQFVHLQTMDLTTTPSNVAHIFMVEHPKLKSLNLQFIGDDTQVDWDGVRELRYLERLDVWSSHNWNLKRFLAKVNPHLKSLIVMSTVRPTNHDLYDCFCHLEEFEMIGFRIGSLLKRIIQNNKDTLTYLVVQQEEDEDVLDITVQDIAVAKNLQHLEIEMFSPNEPTKIREIMYLHHRLPHLTCCPESFPFDIAGQIFNSDWLNVSTITCYHNSRPATVYRVLDKKIRNVVVDFTDHTPASATQYLLVIICCHFTESFSATFPPHKLLGTTTSSLDEFRIEIRARLLHLLNNSDCLQISEIDKSTIATDYDRIFESEASLTHFKNFYPTINQLYSIYECSLVVEI